MQRAELAKELIYDALARMLPTLGRDFTVEITTTPGAGDIVHTDMKFKPLTDMGRAIAPLIRRDLTAAVQALTKERGLTSNGPENNEPPV